MYRPRDLNTYWTRNLDLDLHLHPELDLQLNKKTLKQTNFFKSLILSFSNSILINI